MQFQIKIIAITSTTKPTKNGSYTMLEVAFNNISTGKTDGKKIMSFTNKEIFATLSKANQGDVFDITAEKNANTGYWDWTKVVASSGGGGGNESTKSTTSYSSPKSTYETPEERAKRQTLIVRQSSLSNAIDTLTVNPGKEKIQVDDVLALAQTYYDWVMENDSASTPSMNIADMQDDIPL